MKIKINRKNLLEMAELCAKLVIQPRSPAEAMPNLRLSVSMKQHTTELLASNGEETVVAAVMDSHPEGDCDTMINCAALTTLLKSVDSGYVTLDLQGRQLEIHSNDNHAGTLTATNAAGGPVAPKVPKDADAFILPTNFARLVRTAFKFVAKVENKYPATRGVNLSAAGVTASNGDVLFNVPTPMRIKGSLTIAKQILPTSIGNMPLTMKTWGGRDYEIRGVGFSLYGRGMEFDYPDWSKYIKDNPEYTGRVTLKGDLSELVSFIKGKSMNSEILATVSHKYLHVKSWEGEIDVPAETDCQIGTVLHVKGNDLLDCIELGHREIRFPDNGRSPFKATGGTGMFLFMAQADDASKKDSDNADDGNGSHNRKETVHTSTAVCAMVADKQNKTTQEKEKENMENRTMTQTTAITRFPTTTPQSQPQTQAPQQEAFDELEQLFNGLKETQAMFNDQIANISRKLKAAVTADRQLTREYNKAIGRLEAVRKAI